jgi:multiple sugar transport system permease protein
MTTVVLQPGRWGAHFGRALAYAAVFASLVVMLFPIVWMISTSLKPPSELFRNPPTWIPKQLTLTGYHVALSGQILVSLWNSLLIAAGAAILSTAAGALCAYGLSRLRFRGRAGVLALLIGTLGLPIPMLMLTLYEMFARTGLIDTRMSVVLSHAAITLPVVIWMLKDFFDALPPDFEEAAYLDGARPLRTFVRIVVPLTAPGLTAAGIFVFVTSWNEFIFGLTFTTTSNIRPLPATISLLFLGEFQYRWGDAMAVAVLATIPVMILFIAFERNFVQGMTAGALK